MIASLLAIAIVSLIVGYGSFFLLLDLDLAVIRHRRSRHASRQTLTINGGNIVR